MPILLLISLLALILTKVADIVTTWRGLRRVGIAGERNPFAHWAMRRWGWGGGIAFVMLLWSLVTLAIYLPAWFAPGWYQLVTALGGFLIAWTQADVARMNATGRHSRLTAWFQKGFIHLANFRR